MTLHEVERLPLQKALVQESLEFRLEPFAQIADELPPLLQKHWDELKPYGEGVSLNPNWSWYFDFARANILHCFTARFENILVGYIAMLVVKNSQHGRMQGDAHLFWLDPAFRTGWNAIKFFRFMETVLKEEGVQFINVEHIIHSNLGPMFKYLKYKPKFVIHSKYIGL